MEKYLTKRPRSSVESSRAPSVILSLDGNDKMKNNEMDFNLDDIVSDPALRKSIEDFDNRISDQI